MNDLDRAVERLERLADELCLRSDMIGHGIARNHAADLRTILAALREGREALMAAQSFIADGGLAETDPGASIYRQVSAALSPTVKGEASE